MQQAEYTYATRRMLSKDNTQNGRNFFAYHEDAVGGRGQPRVFKIEISGCDRLAALRKLRDQGTTPYTIYGTEDALIQSVAMEELELRYPLYSSAAIDRYQVYGEL